jgi:hypothetical protein
MADNKILVSLHGAGDVGFGLNKDGDVITRGKFVGRAVDKEIRLFDDFLGDVIADQWNVSEGSDSSTSAVFAVNAAVGGVIKGTTGDDATTTMAVNGIQIDSALNWKAENGGLFAEARLKISAITDVVLFFGLTDQVSGLEMPFTYSGTTLTSNATDGVGFLFDTNATTDNFKAVGVDTDVDATVQDLGVAPVADTYITLRVEVDADGNAVFLINGDRKGTVMAACVTPSVALTPVIAAFSETTTVRDVYVDYIDVGMHRV